MSPDFEQRIRSSFAKQGLMTTLGATLEQVAPGAGALSAIADTAAGYAALSLMPAGVGVLTTEFKVNLLAPAAGERIIARGKVVKAGRTLTVAQTDVFATRERGKARCASDRYVDDRRRPRWRE